jgi:hypothetical protein
MAAVSEFEDRLKKPPIGNEQEKPSAPENNGGLGIVSSLKSKKTEEIIAESVTPTAPVVVQVGNVAAPTGANGALSDLDRMALYVVKGDEFMRESRKRTAIAVLRASASTDEEYNVLVAQLEQVIAVKTKTVEENTPVNKLARAAWDKLNDLLRGE